MKNIITLLLILAFSICVFAQNSTKKYIEIENTTIIDELKYNLEKSENGTYSDLVSYYYNDTLFFVRTDFTSPKTIRIYAFDVKTNIYSYQDIDARNLINNFDNKAYSIDNFAINQDYLVITGHKGVINSQCLYVFRRRKGKEFVYGFEVPLNNRKFSNKIKFLPNGKLLGLKNYVFYGEKPEESSSLSILNLETKEVEKTINLEFLLPLYTIRSPYNILAVNNNSIFFSQRGDYKISEYDFDLNLIGSIENKEIKWERMPQSISDSIHNNSIFVRERIPFLLDNIDKYSCIHNIYSKGNKLFVFYNKKGSFKKIYYDIWTKEGGNWVIQKKGISDNPKSIRYANKQTLTGRSPDDNIYLIDETKFLRLGLPFPDLGFYPKIILMQKAQKYFMNNDIPYAVEIIKFKDL
ncbi:MAG: hypothetical protein PHD45_06400 [Bacteroidales bacterium]|nr:hypothetical protein [Bacteroidales bacterium]